MAIKLEKRSISLKVLIYAFIVIWLIVAAFPFIWTVWGSFKVELDFFSISDSPTILPVGGAKQTKLLPFFSFSSSALNQENWLCKSYCAC